MNLKDYSLKEHIKYTLDSILSSTTPSLRIDTSSGTITCTRNRSGNIYRQSTGSTTHATINDYGTLLVIKYDEDDYRYKRCYEYESFTGINVFYEKNSFKNYLKKSNDFYTKNEDDKTINAYKQKKNSLVTFTVDSKYKLYGIKNLNDVYEEKYTLISNNLIYSKLVNSKISIYMEKVVSKKTGNVRIKSIKSEKIVSFAFEGEPCLLRLLNKSFIFNALISTDLALIIDEVQSSIQESMANLQKTPTYIRNIDEIMEYYKSNGY